MPLNRSFARRVGKTLSTSQKELLESDLPDYSYSNRVLLNKMAGKRVFLEIGFGMGEHFIHQASKEKDAIFIGVEAYLNGVANVLKIAKEQNIINILLWPDDLDLILNDLPAKILDGIYLLFSDPWPKRKHHKKRLFNKERLVILQDKLKEKGFLVFASDMDDYFESSKNIILNNSNFHLLTKDFSQPYDSYIITKYHQKAREAGREAKFLKAIVA